MSQENLDRFARRVLEDRELQARIQATADPSGRTEEFVKVVLEEAAGFTTEELLQVAREDQRIRESQGLSLESATPEAKLF